MTTRQQSAQNKTKSKPDATKANTTTKKVDLELASFQRISVGHNVWKVELQCENGQKLHKEYGPCLVLKQQKSVDSTASIPPEVQFLISYNAETLPVLHWQWCENRKYYQILMPLLPQHSPQSLDSFEKYVVVVVKQLNKIHSLGIIHRDIKPSNICFD
jgi:hypothetical protein